MEVRKCRGCGENDTFAGDQLCGECREAEAALRSEIVTAYLLFMNRTAEVRKYIARDLREALAERLVEDEILS